MKKVNFYLLGIILLITGCDLEKEPVPAYVHLKPFIVDASDGQGTERQKLTDAWVSLAQTGDFLGVYELPATLPIIGDGNTDLVIQPGILENGISATPDIYNFMTLFETTADLTPGETDTIQLATGYNPRVIFHYVEDFEGNNSLNEIIDTTIMTPIEVTSTPGEAFEGNSVKFTLNDTHPKMEVAYDGFMELPTEGDEVFLEMHYKNEGALQVALLGYEDTSSKPVLTFFIALNPRSTWNKVYIDLTNQLVNFGTRFTNFKILFGAQLPDGVSSADYFIDNLKVMEFPDN